MTQQLGYVRTLNITIPVRVFADNAKLVDAYEVELRRDLVRVVNQAPRRRRHRVSFVRPLELTDTRL